MPQQSKFHYEAVAPDGTIVSRRSPRTYLFAILVGPRGDRPNDSWGAWGFSSRRDLADKELLRARAAWAGKAEVVLVPVRVAS